MDENQDVNDRIEESSPSGAASLVRSIALGVVFATIGGATMLILGYSFWLSLLTYSAVGAATMGFVLFFGATHCDKAPARSSTRPSIQTVQQ